MAHKPSWYHTTESRHARGYGAAWDKLRLLILKRDNYLCQCPECLRTGRITKANQVDHIKRKADGGTDVWENLRSVNNLCHERISIQQQGKQARQVTGADGWPVGESWGGYPTKYRAKPQDRRVTFASSVPHDSP